MKIKVNKAVFVNALSKIQGSVNSKPSIAILGCILIKADENGLTIESNNIETSVKVSLDCEVTKPGEVAIPSKKLIPIVKNFPNADITIEFKNGIAVIKCQRSKFKITCNTSDEWVPFHKEDTEIGSLTIEYNDLNKIFEYVHRSVSMDPNRISLTGIFIKIDNDSIKSITSDGRRLSIYEFKNKSDFNCDIIVPLKSFSDAIKILGGKVNIKICNSYIEFNNGTISFMSKLIDANFPNVSAIIPQGEQKTIIINRTLLLDAVSRTSLILDDLAGAVQLDFTGSVLNVNAQSSTDNSSESIECESEPIKLAFNPSYLTDSLKSLISDEIEIKYKESKLPCVIAGDEGYTHIIMPMRG